MNYKRINQEWTAHLREPEAPKKRASAKTSGPKKKHAGVTYTSPFIEEARKKALERAKQSKQRRKGQQKAWNDEFAKEKIQYFDPKTQKEQIFKLKPRNAPSNQRRIDSDSDISPYEDEDYFKPSNKMTTRTTEKVPQHSPQKRYGIAPRDAPVEPKTASDDDDSYDPLQEEAAERHSARPHAQASAHVSVSNHQASNHYDEEYSEDSYDPLAEEQHEKDDIRQQQPSATATTATSPQPQLHPPQHSPMPYSPAASKLVVDTGVQGGSPSPRPSRRSPSPTRLSSSGTAPLPGHMSPTASWQNRQDPLHQSQITRGRGYASPSPTQRGGRSPTASPSRRQQHQQQSSPYRHARYDSQPLRVTTRATSPFDDHTIRRILGADSVVGVDVWSGDEEDREVRSPAHKRSTSKHRHRCTGDWPDTGAALASDPLVRVLEAHARAQEVTSQAHADVMGNMSKMMATLGKAMVAKNTKRRSSRPARDSAAMDWYRSALEGSIDGPGGERGRQRNDGGRVREGDSSRRKVFTARTVPNMSRTGPSSSLDRSAGSMESVDPNTSTLATTRCWNTRAPMHGAKAPSGWTVEQGASGLGRKRAPPSKYKVVDHVLAKLQEMEQHERQILGELTSSSAAARKPLEPTSSTTRHEHEEATSDVHTKPQEFHVAVEMAPSEPDLVAIPSGGNSDWQRNVGKDQDQHSDLLFMVKGHDGTAVGGFRTTSSGLISCPLLHDTADVMQAVRGNGVYVPEGGASSWQREEAESRGLKVLRPDGVIKNEISEYKRELRKCKLLREGTFRANKVTLTETCDRLTDALVEDLLDGAAVELEDIFGELANKFMDKV